jgi:alkylation response protein AidB-like acyl-CoA dehydrogenase
MDGVLVTQKNLYSGLLDWMSAQDLEAGEKYFTDPASQTAIQGSQSKVQQQGQQQAMQMQMLQMQMQLEQAKLQLEKYKTDQDIALKQWTERLHAEIEEAKLIGIPTADLQRIELEARLRAATTTPGNGANGAESS